MSKRKGAEEKGRFLNTSKAVRDNRNLGSVLDYYRTQSITCDMVNLTSLCTAIDSCGVTHKDWSICTHMLFLLYPVVDLVIVINYQVVYT